MVLSDFVINICNLITFITKQLYLYSNYFLTRMVQLPATAAIKYVAAGHFFPGGLLAGGILAGGIFVREAYAHSPQVQCVYEPSRLSVPSIVA